MRFIAGCLLGALIAFAWSSVSWMLLPWHNWYMKSFTNEGQAVTAALQSEAKDWGVYIVPNMQRDMHQDPAKQKNWMDKAAQGPFAFLSVKPSGYNWEMPYAMFMQFLIQLLVAFLACILLSWSTLQSLLGRASFVCLTVTTGAIMIYASNWNWWLFSDIYTVVNIADVAIGWFIAGLFIAKIIRRNQQVRMSL